MAEKKELDFFEGLTSNALARAAYPHACSLVVDTFNANGTWTCPAGIFEIIVECYGGGGAGGNSSYSTDDTHYAYGGGGGGGGAYSKKTIAVTPGQTYNVYVGAAAGDTYFIDTSTVLAKGGTNASGTTKGSGGLAAAGVGDVKYSGADGATGHTDCQSPGYIIAMAHGSGGGGAATNSANGNAGTAGSRTVTGSGGSYGGGNGGTIDGSWGTYNAPGVAGTAPGGGGGGAGAASQSAEYGGGYSFSGGAGSAGQLKISYYPLLAYSENSVVNEGSYSLKFGALITSSLNETLTKTISPVKDFKGINTLHFDIRASRTGSNIKIGIRDSGGVTTEITPNVTSADTWQTVNWDISGVLNANKNALDRIIITVANADAGNVVYIDNFYGDYTAPIYSLEDLNIELRDKDGELKNYLTPYVNSISWEWNRKGGCGNCTIVLKKPYRSLSLSAMDDIQIRIRDGVTSKLIYRGFVESYKPTLKSSQEIRVSVKGYFELLKKLVVHTTGDTRSYSSQTISYIVTDIVDTFVTPNSFITKGTIDTTSFNCDSIKFLTTVHDALQTLADLAGTIEYGVDEDLAFFWRTESATVNNKFIVGFNIDSLERETDYGKLVNKYYLVGGTVSGSKYKRTAEDATSQSNYYLSEEIITNGSITTNTVADQYLGALLDKNAEPIISIAAKVVNTPLRMEDTIPLGKVTFLDPDVDETAYNTQIDRISYSFADRQGHFHIQIETGSNKLDAAARIKRLELALSSEQQN